MSCIISDCDEMASVITEEIRRARKPHRCYECKSTIEKGDTYEYTAALWEYEWHHMHVCLDCVSVRDSLFRRGFTYGEIWEDLKDFMEEQEPDWVLVEKCTPTAKAKIIEIFDSVKS
jgi:hypothetical protein